MNLERVEIKDLNVGDEVYIAYETRWCWSSFRYPTFVKATITRITPKKTKAITDTCGECDKYTRIYKYCDELGRQNKVSLAYKVAVNILSDLSDGNKVSIKSLKDETILKLCDLMKEAKRIVEEDKNEQQAK